MKPDRATLTEMYRRMVRIRRFEDQAVSLQTTGALTGACHTSQGQEGEIVGACMALNTDDYMVGNHRSHGHPIGKGAALKGLLAELLGRKTGVNQGKGGSMHLSDFSVGSLGETSIVGSGLPVATGAALGAKMQGTGRVSLCFFGDGASNEGTFHESLNLAAIWRLPAIFLCENNGYGLTTSASETVAVKDIADRAKGYAIPGIIVDGQDVLAVYEVVAAAVARARSGEGPSLVEAKTYRFEDHSVGMSRGRGIVYRSEEEVERWKLRDPIRLFRERLTGEYGFTGAELDAVDAGIAVEVAEALAFAQASPFPEAGDAFEHMYVNSFPIPR
jgi:TPP-dependent pyruvate/acetoin dehydrogenase alpha subunit